MEEQSTASLCIVHPTANSWQVQWALPPEHTVNHPFSPISTSTTLVQTQTPHLSPSFYYRSLLIQDPHSSQNDL